MRRRRLLLLAAPIVAGTLGLGIAWTSIDTDTDRAGATRPAAAQRHAVVAAQHRKATAVRLVEASRGSLAQPLQDSAAAPGTTPGSAILLGGLSAADASTDTIRLVSRGRELDRGRLPGALHDAAAVRLGDSVYLFGGGDGVRQLADIVRVDPRTGRAAVVGRLPAPSSDLSAAVVDGTAYVVGGYTGVHWLDTILAWRPGSAPRVAGRLPTALRYAAVTAADGKVVIAGGSTPSGSASSTVLAFDPRTGRIRRVGRLPAPTTHAAAATLGSTAYVIGGRGPVSGTPTGRVVAIDPVAGRVRLGGKLASPRSDLAAVALGGQILLAGGRGPGGTEASIGALSPATGRLLAATTRSSVANVYAHDGAGMMSPAVKGVPARIYVPNSDSNTVDEIDPRTFRIVRHFAVGALPQHVTPSYDLKTLYVLNDEGNSVTPLNPRTGTPGRSIPVTDPYNMYFTIDGRYAIVVAERNARLDFRDAHTLRLYHSLPVPCRGVDHMDFSADGSYAIASCEFSGQIVKVDIAQQRVVGTLTLGSGGASPQDVKLSPDGSVFYIADKAANGLWMVAGDRFRPIGFLPTGAGTHGLYPSRDGRFLYATNRGDGSISVISFATRKIVKTWRIPGGGSPDMGGVSADGKVLWLSGRYNGVVYAISTINGRLLARIPVGSGPHGLSVWPQPGRYSLGHTGILR